MQPISIADPPFRYDPQDPEGFRAGMARLGPRAGARRLGATVYELPPGQAVCPYHYELGEEEWVLGLEGVATVRLPDGPVELRPLELLCFPPGRDGAHQVRNDGDERVRVLMWSEVVHPSATVYPDSDKIGIWTGGDRRDDLIVRRSSGVPYYDGEG
ncbi:MAG: cupin domain-containing protein [Solirubrobacteraceae bacterium]|nr:cupin domain-containing protein [Solirubrobacteraceae bacterium]